MSLIDFLDSVEPRILDEIGRAEHFPCEIPVFHSLEPISRTFRENPAWKEYATIAAVFHDYQQVWIKFRVKVRRPLSRSFEDAVTSLQLSKL